MILEISISNFKSIENARKLDEKLNEILLEEMRK
jgi:AAA15 family ATPase/GTPase